MRTSPLATWLVAGALLALTGCASLNPFAASAPKPAELVAFEPAAELRTVWQARIGSAGGYAFEPAVVGEDVYAAAHDGSVARYRDGQSIWRASAGKRLSAGVGSDGQLAVVVTTDGEVVAFEAEGGAERWRVPLNAEVLAPPAVGATMVVVRASDSRLVALDARDGTRRWVYQRSTPPLALRSFSGVVLDGQSVIVGYPGGKLVGLNVENGGPQWELTVATPRGVTELERITDVVGTAVVGRRELCAVAYQGRVVCFDMSNGSAIWARDFSSSVGMDKDTRFVFITDDADAVHALDAFSGASVWKQDAMSRRAVSRPLVVGGHVVVGDREGYVHLLDRETGAFAARLRADSSAIVAPPKRLGSRRFVVQTLDGGLYVLEAG